MALILTAGAVILFLVFGENLIQLYLNGSSDGESGSSTALW